MIGLLAGNERSVYDFRSCVGKTISSIHINDKRLLLTFDDGTKLKLFDAGQSCCENRYMYTDDELHYFEGGALQYADIREGPTELDEYGEPKESAFLIISTSKGQFTVSNYNEHNGYYGGFLIEAEIILEDWEIESGIKAALGEWEKQDIINDIRHDVFGLPVPDRGDKQSDKNLENS